MARHYEGLRNQDGVGLNWTHQSLVYTDGVNLLIENMKAAGKNKYAQRDASKVVDLEVNRGPIKCVEP